MPWFEMLTRLGWNVASRFFPNDLGEEHWHRRGKGQQQSAREDMLGVWQCAIISLPFDACDFGFAGVARIRALDRFPIEHCQRQRLPTQAFEDKTAPSCKCEVHASRRFAKGSTGQQPLLRPRPAPHPLRRAGDETVPQHESRMGGSWRRPAHQCQHMAILVF